MRRLFEKYPNRTHRLIEILVPLCTYALITMPLWLSIWHPALVAYLLITFNVYWFYKAATMTYFGVKAFLTLLAHSRIDWHAEAKKVTGYDSLYHAVLIPEFKEPAHILKRTLDAIIGSEYDSKKIIIVLAQEAKDLEAENTAKELTQLYANRVSLFLVTRHELKPGEVAGKSSNMAWAGKELVKELVNRGIAIENVTVTSCDADALLHPKYLAYLTCKFLTSTDRYHHFYQGAILFYTNIWRVPLPSRVFNTFGSFFNLSLLGQSSKFINFSTYSLALKTAVDSGYWGVDVIPEDYHLFFKVYFRFGEAVHTESIFLPILVDAAESRGFWRTMVNQYEQSKRWAWGVSDLPFVIRGMVMHREIPFFDRLRRFILILEHHIFWPANWFLLTVGSTIPPLVNPAFGRTALGHNLSRLSSGILTLSFLFIIAVIIVDMRLKPPRPKEFQLWKTPLLLFQWITIPVVSFFLGALPGLDAHTRLMLGKRLEYRVTEKV